MLRSLTSAVSGMQNSQDRMDVIGNNIANVNTTAFKASRMDFADAFSQTLRAPTAAGANNAGAASVQVGTGVTSTAIKSIYTQGPVTKTDVPTDLAIEGEGFFLVRDAISDTQYATRSGEFRELGGYLVNNQGMHLRGYSDTELSTVGDLRIDTAGRPPSAATLAAETAATNAAAAEAAAIRNGTTLADMATAAEAAAVTAKAAAEADPGNADLATAAEAAEAAAAAARAAVDAPAKTAAALASARTSDTQATVTSFSIDKEGKINVRLSDGTEFVRGQILLQNFRDPQSLQKEGNNLYSALETAGPLGTPGSPSKNGLGGIKAGHLELSNVDIANEFANLITTQRAFQANARIITTSDDLIQEVVNLKR